MEGTSAAWRVPVVSLHDVLAIDPGAKPGFAWFSSGVLQKAGWEPKLFPENGWHEIVHEAQHAAASLWRNGRRVRIRRSSQSTLSFTAGRLFERFKGQRKYRILPDAWRRVLWPGSRRLPKAVVLARLETEYGHLVVAPKGHRGDVLEAVGIGAAWGKLSNEQKELFRVE